MHEGMLLLATIAVVVRFLVNIAPKVPVLGWFFSEESLQKIARVSENVAFVAGLGGAIGILASAATGTVLSTPTRIIEDEVLNKIMISIFAFVFWADFLAIRLKYGEERIWTNRVLQFFYPLIGVIGFAFVTVAGSIGGSLAGKESILDFMFQNLNIDKRVLWVLPQMVDVSKMIVSSPLQSLGNVSSTLQIVVIINIIVTVLVMVYLQIGNKTKRS
jgi:hypothetical protein